MLSENRGSDIKVPTLSFDAAAVRTEFPVLCQTLESGLRPVYLDSGASAQKPRQVIAKEREVEEQYFANAYRGRYSFGARVDDELEASRSKIASFIHAESTSCVSFCPGTTIGLNMVAFGWGRRHVHPGDEILITLMEHHANFVPWQQLALERNATLKFIPLTSDGRLDLDQLAAMLTPRVKVISVCGMSNVLGTVNPIEEIVRMAGTVDACVVIDGAQSVPHLATDVQASGIDFLVFSGHKLYGPTGVGVLYGKPDRLAVTDPIFFGGHMIDQVSVNGSTWTTPPARFEAGTLPIVQAIALGTAVDWIQRHGLDNIHHHEQTLLTEATRRLTAIPGMKIYGPEAAHKGGIISFRMDQVHPEDLAAMLDRKGVFTRHGHHCTMPLHQHLNVSATTRVSFGAYNTIEDIDVLIEAIEFARRKLRVAP
jgi:cysteine desulfurase / selenocysteine lyase